MVSARRWPLRYRSCRRGSTEDPLFRPGEGEATAFVSPSPLHCGSTPAENRAGPGRMRALPERVTPNGDRHLEDSGPVPVRSHPLKGMQHRIPHPAYAVAVQPCDGVVLRCVRRAESRSILGKSLPCQQAQTVANHPRRRFNFSTVPVFLFSTGLPRPGTASG